MEGILKLHYKKKLQEVNCEMEISMQEFYLEVLLGITAVEGKEGK